MQVESSLKKLLAFTERGPSPSPVLSRESRHALARLRAKEEAVAVSAPPTKRGRGPDKREDRVDALALSYALRCSYEPLRLEAHAIIVEALRRNGGHKESAACELGVSRAYLFALLRELREALERPVERLQPPLEPGRRPLTLTGDYVDAARRQL